jgi:uncharacterized phage protein (TIGR01671 family)
MKEKKMFNVVSIEWKQVLCNKVTDYFHFNIERKNQLEWCSPTELEIMRFTGRLDKDGVRIYEEDIITVEEWDFTNGGHKKKVVCEVGFNETGASFNIYPPTNLGNDIYEFNESDIYTVIGNFYQGKFKKKS